MFFFPVGMVVRMLYGEGVIKILDFEFDHRGTLAYPTPPLPTSLPQKISFHFSS